MMDTKRIAIIAVLIAAAVFGARYFMIQPEETASAPGQAMVQVSVPAFSDAEKAGEGLFNSYCASCHGANAAGQEGKAPPLVHVIYEPNHHADAAFLLAAQNGVRAHHWSFGNMPPVEGATKEEVTKILAYVRALQRENGIF